MRYSFCPARSTPPRGLKKDEAKIELVIVDEKNKPKVWFAVDGQKVDGWQPMTSIDLT